MISAPSPSYSKTYNLLLIPEVSCFLLFLPSSSLTLPYEFSTRAKPGSHVKTEDLHQRDWFHDVEIFEHGLYDTVREGLVNNSLLVDGKVGQSFDNAAEMSNIGGL